MTVETSTRKANFAGGQSALTFTFRTLANHPEYIKVLVTSGSTQTVLTYSSDYTVALDADGVGGVVTVSPSYSTAYTYTLYRDTDDLQESDYDDFNQFPAGTLENDIDRRTLISQERAEDSDRTARLPISSTISSVTLPDPEDGKSLVWSGSSGVLINSSLTGSTGAIGPTGPTGPSGGGVSIVSSSTAEITVVSTSTTPIITAVNAFTGGANVILRLTSAGFLPALNASLLTNITKTFKIINFSYNTAATSGTLDITGFGFTPSTIMIIAAVAAGKGFTIGYANGTQQANVCDDFANATSLWDTATDRCVKNRQGAGDNVVMAFNAFIGDGVRLTTTKTGSPTGNLVGLAIGVSNT